MQYFFCVSDWSNLTHKKESPCGSRNQLIISQLFYPPACCSRGVSFIVASIVDNPDSRALPAVFDILNAFYIHYQ